jgi:hypothetical protein
MPRSSRRLGNIKTVIGTSSAIGRIIHKAYRGQLDVNEAVKFVQMLATHRDTLLMATLEQRMLEFESRLATDPTTRGVYVLPPVQKKEKAIDLTALVKGPPTDGE